MSQKIVRERICAGKPAIYCQIRWMIRRDMAEVLNIEHDSFEFPWTEEDFLGCLRQRNCIGMIAEGPDESHLVTGPVTEYWAQKFWKLRSGKPSTKAEQLRDFENAQKQVTAANRVIGFMIYELHKTRLHVLNFAVSPLYRRWGIASIMTEKLINKLSQQRRQEILLEVRETNLAAQYFFHSQGFRAVRVLRNYYCENTEDAYLMKYQMDEPVETYGCIYRSRISTYYDAEAV